MSTTFTGREGSANIVTGPEGFANIVTGESRGGVQQIPPEVKEVDLGDLDSENIQAFESLSELPESDQRIINSFIMTAIGAGAATGVGILAFAFLIKSIYDNNAKEEGNRDLLNTIQENLKAIPTTVKTAGENVYDNAKTIPTKIKTAGGKVYDNLRELVHQAIGKAEDQGSNINLEDQEPLLGDIDLEDQESLLSGDDESPAERYYEEAYYETSRANSVPGDTLDKPQAESATGHERGLQSD